MIDLGIKMTWTRAALRYAPSRLAGNPRHILWMTQRLGDGLMVDVGANVGALCIASMLRNPGARCVAFEPQRGVADALEGMIAANDVPVELHRVAVGAEPGEAVLSVPKAPRTSGWATLAERPPFEVAISYSVPVTTLDVWWNEAGRPDVQVVKVDAQGAELDILAGGRELLQTVPVLFIEDDIPALVAFGRTETELVQALRALDYEWDIAGRNLRCEKRRGWIRPN